MQLMPGEVRPVGKGAKIDDSRSLFVDQLKKLKKKARKQKKKAAIQKGLQSVFDYWLWWSGAV